MKKKYFIKIAPDGRVTPNGAPMSKIIFVFLFEKIKKMFAIKTLLVFILLISFLICFLVENHSTFSKLGTYGIMGAIIFFIFLFCFLNKKPKF